MGLDEMIGEFDLNEIEEGALKERLISLRLPENYKVKYDVIQARSKKRFADHLRQVVMAAIDRVELDTKVG